jgi:hypothetical protein
MEERLLRSESFKSSWVKIERAKKHILDLDREVQAFLDDDPWEQISHPDPNVPKRTVHKIRLSKTLPDLIPAIIGDATNNLRASLDHATFAIAECVALKNGSAVGEVYFPFSGKDTRFESNLNGRCKNIPDEIRSIFRGLRPYPGGNKTLWSLNEICSRDKHKIVTPIAIGAFSMGYSSIGDGYFSAVDDPVWDRHKKEIEFMTVGTDSDSTYKYNFRMFVAFTEIESVDGRPVVSVIRKMASHVEIVVSTLEQASRDLGLIV